MAVAKKDTTTPEKVVAKQTSEIDELRASNAELQNTVQQMMEEMRKLVALAVEKDTPVVTAVEKSERTYSVETDVYNDMLPEPDANKQVQVISMFYGTLNLSTSENRHNGKTLTFDRYGQVKPVMYRDLVDYVNTNRKFAERGYFYILDKAAVYYTGMSYDYANIVSPEIMNSILEYGESAIKSIVSVMVEEQRETLVSLLSERMYNGEDVDRNKVAVISRESGVDIEARVSEMKQYNRTEK